MTRWLDTNEDHVQVPTTWTVLAYSVLNEDDPETARTTARYLARLVIAGRRTLPDEKMDEMAVEHVDGDPSNNDPANLRVVPTRQRGER